MDHDPQQMIEFQNSYFDYEWGLLPFSWLDGVKWTPGGNPYFFVSAFPSHFACHSCHAIRPTFYRARGQIRGHDGKYVYGFYATLNWDVSLIWRHPAGFVCPDCAPDHRLMPDMAILPWFFYDEDLNPAFVDALDAEKKRGFGKGRDIIIARNIIDSHGTQ